MRSGVLFFTEEAVLGVGLWLRKLNHRDRQTYRCSPTSQLPPTRMPSPPTMSLFLSSRRRHTRYPLVTGVQTCALPIYFGPCFGWPNVPKSAGIGPPEENAIRQIGRASCRERGEISGGAGSLKKKKHNPEARRRIENSRSQTEADAASGGRARAQADAESRTRKRNRMGLSLQLSQFFSSRRRHTRYPLVTGVKTCALPISSPFYHFEYDAAGRIKFASYASDLTRYRSEERRVGKEGRSRWAPYH